jgi:glutaredoxin 3
VAEIRKVEVFSAGCLTCNEAIELVKQTAGYDITVHDMQDREVAKRAKELGIRSVPAVVIDGKVAACCRERGVDVAVLRAAGLGTAQ